MADRILDTRIVQRNDITANWNTNNPILKKGEEGVEFLSDGTSKKKVGDGVKRWSELPYSTVNQNEFDTAVHYSNSVAIVQPIGGIEAGETFDNVSVNEMLTKLLYPYVAPVINSFTSSPNGGTFEKGTTQNITQFTLSVTTKSDEITQVDISDVGRQTGLYLDGRTEVLPIPKTVTENKYFTLSIKDARNKTYTKNSGTFNFVYPYYHGAMGATETISEAIVTSLTKRVEAKGNKTYSFTTDNQKMVFAYPASYGNLKKIVDPNGFDNTATFTKNVMNITGLDGTAQSYNVYVANDPSSVTAFNMQFQY